MAGVKSNKPQNVGAISRKRCLSASGLRPGKAFEDGQGLFQS